MTIHFGRLLKKTIAFLLFTAVIGSNCLPLSMDFGYALYVENTSSPQVGQQSETELLAETEPPAGAELPAGTETPAETEPPADTEPPAETEPPEETDSPIETQPPEETESPAETEPPEGTDPPIETEIPTETELPAETEQPTETDLFFLRIDAFFSYEELNAIPPGIKEKLRAAFKLPPFVPPAANVVLTADDELVADGPLATADTLLSDDPLAAADALLTDDPLAADALLAGDPLAADALLADDPLAADPLASVTNAQAQELQALDLSGNTELTYFPAWLGRMSGLTTLNLSGQTHLSASFSWTNGMWPNLKTLNLSGTQITGFSVPNGEGNSLTSVNLSNCAALTVIDIGDSALMGINGTNAFHIAGCASLTRASFGEYALKDYAGALQINASNTPTLETLIIGDYALQSIPSANFSSMTRLQTVSVGAASLQRTGTFTLANTTSLGSVTIRGGGLPNTATLTLAGSSISSLSILSGSGPAPTLGALTTLIAPGAAAAWGNLSSVEIGAGAIPLMSTKPLSFAYNPLTSLRIDATALPNLQTLTLSYTDIAGVGAGSGLVFEGGAGALGALQTLNLLSTPNLMEFVSSPYQMSNLKTVNFKDSGLTRLTIADDSLNGLTSLVLTNATNLSSLSIGNNALNSLTALTLTGLTALEGLRIPGNACGSLASIAASDLSGLKSFIVEDGTAGAPALNSLKTLAMIRNANLETVSIGDYALNNSGFVKFDMTGNAALKKIRFPTNSLLNATSVVLTNCTGLNVLTFDERALPLAAAAFVHSSIQGLTEVNIGRDALPQLTSLALPNNPNLQSLHIPSGALKSATTLNLTNCTGLQSLSIEEGTAGGETLPEVKTLTLTGAVNIGTLTIGDYSLPKITALSLAGNEQLQSLTIPAHALLSATSINISGCKMLRSFVVEAGTAGAPPLPSLTSLTIKTIPTLAVFSVGAYAAPQVKNLVMEGNTALTSLVLEEGSFGGLTHLDLRSSGIERFESKTGAAPGLATFYSANSPLADVIFGDGSALALIGFGNNNGPVLKNIYFGAGIRDGLTSFRWAPPAYALSSFSFSPNAIFPQMTELSLNGMPLQSRNPVTGEGGSFGPITQRQFPALYTLALMNTGLTSFDFSDLPDTLYQIHLSHNSLAQVNLGQSKLPNLFTLNLEYNRITEIFADDSDAPMFSNGALDIFRVNNNPLTSIRLSAQTVNNIITGSPNLDIDLHDTLLPANDLFMLMLSTSVGNSNLTIRLPENWSEYFNWDNPSTGKIVVLYSEQKYNTGNKENPIMGAVLTDTLHPVFKVEPWNYYDGIINDMNPPFNAIGGPYQAIREDLDMYLNGLPADIAGGIRAILYNGYPFDNMGLSANDAACATFEAVAAFLNENAAALDQERLSALHNYSNPEMPDNPALKYSSPEGGLGSAVINLLTKARAAQAYVPTEGTPALTATITAPLEKGEDGFYYASVSVAHESINQPYVISSRTRNILEIQGYTGKSGDTLSLKVDPSDLAGKVEITLSASNVEVYGDYYVAGRDDKSSYIAVTNRSAIDYFAAALLRDALPPAPTPKPLPVPTASATSVPTATPKPTPSPFEPQTFVIRTNDVPAAYDGAGSLNVGDCME